MSSSPFVSDCVIVTVIAAAVMSCALPLRRLAPLIAPDAMQADVDDRLQQHPFGTSQGGHRLKSPLANPVVDGSP
jgi:hypothetical protein